MFSLDEIKEINKAYIYDSDTKELKLRSKSDTSSIQPENLTQTEKNKIISACFLNTVINDLSRGGFAYKPRDKQEILDEIQTNFYKEAIKPEKRVYTFATAMGGNPVDTIFSKLASGKPIENSGAEEYLQYVLSSSGKKATNIQRGLDGGMALTISYDIEPLEKKNEFKEQLNPNNSIYTQSKKKLNLPPDELAKRKEIVEKLITYYKKMEHDDWYAQRKEDEDINMKRVADTVNKNQLIASQIKGPKLLRILCAAQNLSIDGEQDFLEEMLKQPSINDSILELKKSGIVHKMRLEAEENEKNGKINNNGLVGTHNLTEGEKLNERVNEYVRGNPDAITFAKNHLKSNNSYTTEYGNKESMENACVIELIAKSQGKLTERTRNNDGNIVLQVDDEKEQSK